MSTNIQDFSGDVQIRGTTFIKANRGTGDIAIGTDAGLTSQGNYATAVGNAAGSTSQGVSSVAVGHAAALTGQGTNSVAVGVSAGNNAQGAYAVGVGRGAGQVSQGAETVAVGDRAGFTSQGAGAIAIGTASGYNAQGGGGTALGRNAGQENQGEYAVAVGAFAAQNNQAANSVAVGYNAALTGQGTNAIAVGNAAGSTSQGVDAVAVGVQAGSTNQAIDGVAVGRIAGQTSQGPYTVAVGSIAGNVNQRQQAVAVGHRAGEDTQGSYAVAVGTTAARFNQGAEATAVGLNTGYAGQGNQATALGAYAGSNNQGGNAVAVGYTAGQVTQGAQCVAIGWQAGRFNQVLDGVAIGRRAGENGQKFSGITIGNESGLNNQGEYAVAVGFRAGENNQGAHGIAMGEYAGYDAQGAFATALGAYAGHISQGGNATAVGHQAGAFNQAALAVAIGHQAGLYTQATGGIAIGHATAYQNSDGLHTCVGYAAGYNNTGTASVLLGAYAGSFGNPGDNQIIINATGSEVHSATSGSFFLRSMRTIAGGTAMYYNGSEIYMISSDDRVKDGEIMIKEALKTIFKLKPQSYDKRADLDPTDSVITHESGFMAQDIYYDVPELRHMVRVPDSANPTPEKPPSATGDPRDDPDYSAWGPDIASIDHLQIIPYTVKAIQEIVNELPRSKTTILNTWGQNTTGLVVSANTNKYKTNTTPILTLSNVYMDKTWYGVISDINTDTNDYDTLVDTKGDTRIWVADVGGALESGDLLTTSNVTPGYAQKQESGALMNYTIAKITQDCDFTEPEQRPIMQPKQELKSVTIYIDIIKERISYSEYVQIPVDEKKIREKMKVFRDYRPEMGGIDFYYNGDGDLIDRKAYDLLPEEQRSILVAHQYTTENYEKLDEDIKEACTEVWIDVYYKVTRNEFTYPHPSHETVETKEMLVDVLDENGQIVWEETGETEPVYTLVDHGTYKAALVSCKLI